MSKKKRPSRKPARSSAKRSRRSRPASATASRDAVSAAESPDLKARAAPELDVVRQASAERTQELAARAMKYADNPKMREQLEKLTQEEAAVFVLLLEKQLAKRRLQLVGYGVALLVFLIGMAVAFYFYGNREPGEFMGWAFLIPFILVAGVFLLFGRLSSRK